MPATSKRLRQRTFLQPIRSSLRTMYDWALAKRARSRSSALRPSAAFFRRTSQPIWYSSAFPQCGQVRVCVRCSGFSSKKSRSSIGFPAVSVTSQVTTRYTSKQKDTQSYDRKVQYGGQRGGKEKSAETVLRH